MLKKVSTLLLIAVFALSAMSFAGSKTAKYAGRAPRAIDVEGANSIVFNVPQGERSMVFTYTTVDTMANAYGPGSGSVNPIAYDPYSNSVVIIHRSKSTYASGGSGGIFYAYSKDGGATWTPRQGPLSNGLANDGNGRYPSIALHNPTMAASSDSVLVQFQFPLLVGGAFGGMIYGADPGVGANSPLSNIDSAGVPWWSSMTSNSVFGDASFVFGVINASTDGFYSIFQSDDGITFTQIDPPQFAVSVFNDGNFDDINAIAYRNGNYYLGARGQFMAAPQSDSGSYTFGVSKSTDKGKTWSDLDIVPWKALVPSNYVYNIYSADFAVDGAGGYHFLTAGIDTNVTPQLWSLFHMYKASGGAWTSTKIKDLPAHDNWTYGGLGQTLIELNLSVSANGEMVAAKWLEDSRGATYLDSLPVADVWTSAWKSGQGWSTPVNRTNTPAVNDQLVHVAPYFANNGKIHIMRNQSVTTSGHAGDMDVHVTKIDYSSDIVTGVSRNEDLVASKFELSQNYPNPFNPTTTISFSVPVNGDVSMKVYNMVGQEVATIVSGYQTAGFYMASFDASKLSSGVYFYKLQAGSFSQVKKMMLLK